MKQEISANETRKNHQWHGAAGSGQLRPGSLVEIVEGAFLGYRGIIVDNDNRLRLELLFTGSLSTATVEHTLVKLI